MTLPLGESVVPTDMGFRTALFIGAGVSVIAALVAAFIPATKATAKVEPQRTLVSATKQDRSTPPAGPAPCDGTGRGPLLTHYCR